MKKVVFGLLIALSTLFAVTISASAAPPEAKAKNPGPFDGSFNGMVHADKNTKAPLSLVLTHKGNQVEGNLFLGEGLYVDGGMCGSGYIPASTQFAAGKTSAKNPRQLSATSTFKVNGVNVKVILDSEVSANGKQIDAKAKIDLPWFCGGDPVLDGTLYQA